MKILADENVDRPLVEWLRRTGYDVCWQAESGPGEADRCVLDRAWREDRVLLTLDRDFGYLAFHAGNPIHGVVYLRLAANSPAELLGAFQSVRPRVEPRIAGHFVVVTRKKVRVRPLSPPVSD